MVKATFSVLSEKDKQLVLETEPRQLEGLSEDELLDLHQRVRRARNRHSKLYRREAAGQVRSDRTRGRASKSSQRNAARAEVFEDALARVSRSLARAARASATELRDSRLAQAGKGSGKAKPSKKSGSSKKASGKKATAKGSSAKGKKVSPATKKARASTLATGKRRQAKKDAR